MEKNLRILSLRQKIKQRKIRLMEFSELGQRRDHKDVGQMTVEVRRDSLATDQKLKAACKAEF